VIVGIDNGLDGGLCAISKHSGSVIARSAMPTLKRAGKREVDTKAVFYWICNLNTEPLIAIEEPLKHAKTSQAMRSMGISFGKILGMCETHDLKVRPIQVLDWQKKMLGKVPKSQTKVFALRKATELAPDEDWLATARSYVPHDGIVDAYLIARYAREKYAKG